MKENKGITLVALIITIIVLLILAVVTINAVNEGSLFAHANNAATKYTAAAEEENSMISSYISKVEEYAKEKPASIVEEYAKEKPASIWWYNKGLTSTNVVYDKSFKGDNDDEVIISSSGGFSKFTAEGVDYIDKVSKAVLDDPENQEFWEHGFVHAQDNIFYWVNFSDGSVYIVNFNTDNIKFYITSGSDTSGAPEDYLASHTPTETFILQQ